MAALLALRKYVQQDVTTLPESVLFKHTANNITIFDGFPKSIFHFLVLPRIQLPELDAKVLSNLPSLLRADKDQAKRVIESLAEHAYAVKEDIENEMIKRYGFKWDVWIGFHGAPSMVHLHLHVMSADLCSDRMKNKKHYNSFHPKLGFFIHLGEILELFDATPSFYEMKVKQLDPNLYEPLLKKPLTCFRCEKEMKNIPTLKEHLEAEWDKLLSRATKSMPPPVPSAPGKRKLQPDRSFAAPVQEGMSRSQLGSSKKAKPEQDEEEEELTMSQT